MTCEADIKAVNTYLPDYIGFVLFFPKSNRNISIEQAEHLLEKVDKKIRTVAVVVSPTTEQIRQIEKAGFDYIQIHGTVTEDVYKQCKLPILRAFNVSDLDKLNEYEAKDKIKGYVFDSKTPGSGKTFDWSLLDNIRQRQKINCIPRSRTCGTTIPTGFLPFRWKPSSVSMPPAVPQAKQP